LIVDDCAPLRMGTRRILEQAEKIRVIGEAGNGSLALALIARTQPDVVLLDVRLPDLCGMEVAAMAREQGYTARILAYTSHQDDEYVRGMMASGVLGYVLKEESPEKIIEAVLTVGRSGRWFSRAVLERIAEWRINPPASLEFTVMEERVLRLLTRDLTNQEIADELCLEETTVRFHLRNIFAKLRVKTRAGAAVWAVRNGYDKK